MDNFAGCVRAHGQADKEKARRHGDGQSESSRSILETQKSLRI